MKTTRIIAIGVIAASLGLFSAGLSVQAKTLREAEIPAEFPPASFKGKQYVDSRGCVYIRAGIDGLVNWVPRVSRSREVLCGYKPTFAKSAAKPVPAKPAANVQVIRPAAAPAPKPAPKPAAKPRTTPKPKPVKIAKTKTPAAKPAPRRVVKAAKPVAKPAPVIRKTRRVASAPQAKPVVIAPTAAVKPAPKPVVKRATRARTAPKPTQVTSCPGVTGISRLYTGVGDGIRCGPQTVPYLTEIRREPVTVMRNGKKVVVKRRVVRQRAATATAANTAPGVRVVPRHVWEQQQNARIDNPIPKGYRPVWKDDRLNRKRAHQTFAGIRATDLAWTRTVPRKLYLRETGLVVTRDFPGLKYPYLSYDEMRTAGYNVTPPAKPSKRLAAYSKRRAKAPALVSTKSVAPRATAPQPRQQPQAAGKPRYVQLGTFSVPANADKTAAQARARGLPVRLGTLKKGGKSYRIVLAGPYTAAQAEAALSQARRAGYRDAFLR